ncbi:MAG: ankyrin repeat domain-containing protein [Candidatus Brocadiia bacterium]
MFATPAVRGAAVTVRIDTNRTHQTMDGFGTCFVTWEILPQYYEPSFYDRLVFDLGLSIVRCPVPQSLEVANDDGDPDHFNWDGFGQADMERRMAFMKEFRRRGVDHFFASLWSPPGWMKTNSLNLHGGALRPDMREEFAEFIAAFVAASEKFYDIPIRSISLQNELYFVEPYNACVYSPWQIREAVRAVMRKFEREGMPTLIMMPEEMGFAERFNWYVRPTMEDPETREFPGFFCCHGGRGGLDNWQRLWSGIAGHGRRLWMSEAGAHGRRWRSALAMARGIHNGLVGANMSAWIFWQATGLLGPDGPNDAYHAAKHFSRFVRPGSVRVETASSDPSLLVSAYRHRDASGLTIVAINMAPETVQARFSVRGSLVPGRYHAHISTGDAPMQRVGAGQGGQDFVLNLPGWSIVTRQGPGEALPPEPVELADPTPLLERYSFGRPERLHFAARDNDIETVRRLIAEGWDVDQPNITGLRPLHRAAWPGHAEVTEVLLAAGADPNVRDIEEATPLHIAASQGYLSLVDMLLNAGADPNTSMNTGWTPLHRAATSRNAQVVESLLEAGADVNATAHGDWTPLHAAVSSPYADSLAAARILLAAGADVNAATTDGWTPLHAAAANGITAYRVPAELTNGKVQALLAAGADLNARDERGRTPLHWAAWIGHFKGRTVDGRITKELMAAGADPNATDHMGRTPLHYAAMEGYPLVATALVEGGAAPDSTDRDGVTPLMIAEQRGRQDTAEAIRAARPAAPSTTASAEQDLSLPDPEQQALAERLRAAVRLADREAVDELPQAGANPDLRDDGGRTALHHAAVRGHAEMVRVLMEAGADPTIMDNDGFRPVDRANQMGHDETARILREAMD